MASVNKVIVIGNLGRDPEVRYATSGVAVCTLSVATTRSWKDKSGEKQEETEWHRIVLYDRMAENAGEYLQKGRPVYIEGRLKTRKWTDKDGVEKYTTEIVGEQMQFLGGRDEGGGDRDQGGRRESQRPKEMFPAGARGSRSTPAPKTGTGFDDMDDDIPF